MSGMPNVAVVMLAPAMSLTAMKREREDAEDGQHACGQVCVRRVEAEDAEPHVHEHRHADQHREKRHRVAPRVPGHVIRPGWLVDAVHAERRDPAAEPVEERHREKREATQPDEPLAWCQPAHATPQSWSAGPPGASRPRHPSRRKPVALVGSTWVGLGNLRAVRRLGVLASGTGTILQAILDADLPVGLVVVDRPCPAHRAGRVAGVPVELVERTSFGPEFDRAAYTHRVVGRRSSATSIDLVAMAGFGTVLAEPDPRAFPDGSLNTHPALLPAFKGWHAVEDALAAGVKVTGWTVHVATARGRRRADPRPGGRAVLAGRHRRHAARTDQGGRARAATRRCCSAAARRGRSSRRPGAGAALGLRQDRPRRPSHPGSPSSASSSSRQRRHRPARCSARPASPRAPWSRVTGAPEMLGGRVKTLHPRIHGGHARRPRRTRAHRRPRAPGHRADRARRLQPLPVRDQPRSR